MTSEDRQQLERLYSMSLNFLARARECCEELNPNNFKAESLLWQAHEGLGQYLEVIRCRLESPWKEALQTTNPTLDPGSVGLSANPMTGKSIDKPISPSNEDVLARMAEAESADLPHIKLKDEVRGEGDAVGWKEQWAMERSRQYRDSDQCNTHSLEDLLDEAYEAGYRSRDGEVLALQEQYDELCSANQKLLDEHQRVIEKFASKLERMELALKYFEDAQCDCSIEERLSGHLVGCWKPEADEKIRQALTDEVKG